MSNIPPNPPIPATKVSECNASERSFSAMNYIIDKFRASMEVERSNEANYIYMNTKALHRAVKEATGWFHLSDLEENALEDDIIAMSESQEEMGSPKQSRKRQAIEVTGAEG